MTKLQTGVSYSKYMSLYTVSYNYCTSSKMHGTGDQAGGMGHRSEYLSVQATPMFIDLTAAGANLMGSDLYNNLIRYFVKHLKGLRTVSTPRIVLATTPRNLLTWALVSPSRHRTATKMRRYYGTTLRSGIGTRLAQITLIVSSHTSTAIGSSASETREGRASIPYTPCVSLLLLFPPPRHDAAVLFVLIQFDHTLPGTSTFEAPSY